MIKLWSNQSQQSGRDHGWRNGGAALRNFLPLQADHLHRRCGTGVHKIDIRPFVHDHRAASRVAVGDVRHVHRVLDNGHIALRLDDASEIRPPRAKSLALHEVVVARADIVILVHACVEAASAVRLGRKRRPADVRIAFPPRHPGRSPFAAGDPHPAFAGVPHPASVMPRRPAVRLVRTPRPALLAAHPLAVGVRPPAPVLLRLARKKNGAVSLHFIPVAVWIEGCVKEVGIPASTSRRCVARAFRFCGTFRGGAGLVSLGLRARCGGGLHFGDLQRVIAPAKFRFHRRALVGGHACGVIFHALAVGIDRCTLRGKAIGLSAIRIRSPVCLGLGGAEFFLCERLFLLLSRPLLGGHALGEIGVLFFELLDFCGSFLFSATCEECCDGDAKDNAWLHDLQLWTQKPASRFYIF